MRFYDFSGPDELVCIYAEKSGSKLGRIDLNTGRLHPIELLYTTLFNVQVSGRKAAMYASSATLAERVLVVDLDTAAQEVVKVANPAHIDPGYFSIPQAIEFPTEGDVTAHAFFYPPKNKDHDGPPGELAPLVVHSHGGPTSAVGSTFNL